MSTDTPYSDQWRARTRERLADTGLSVGAMVEGCGVDGPTFVITVAGDGPVSLEVAGPIDEWLDRMEEQAEAEALVECTVHHPGVGSPRVRRVDVDLGPLADCDAIFEGRWLR